MSTDRPTTDHGAAGFCTDHTQPADRPTAVAEAVEAGARVLRARAAAAQLRAGGATDAEWDEMLAVSHLIGEQVLRIDGPPEVIATAVLEAVGYADLLGEVENLRITVREDKWVMDRDATVTDTPTEGACDSGPCHLPRGHKGAHEGIFGAAAPGLEEALRAHGEACTRCWNDGLAYDHVEAVVRAWLRGDPR